MSITRFWRMAAGAPVAATAAAAILLLASAGTEAVAQGAADYPNRPIRVVVGFAAGGGNDLFARIVANKMSEVFKQPVIVENKAGAGGRLSSDYVSKQPADGYTVMVGASGQMSIASAIYPKLGYHPTKSFIPLTMIASFPLILVVPANHPAKDVKEMVTWAKANPDKANYASSSPAFGITTELLKLKTGMPGTAIPYKSSNESMLSVAGGQTLLTISDGPPAVPLVKGGQVRALAVTGSQRSAELPDVPSMAEVGFPEVDVQLWSGLFVAAGTPPDIAAKLETELRKIMVMPDVADKLKAMATTPSGMSGKDFAKYIDNDIEKFTAVVKAANLKFED